MKKPRTLKPINESSQKKVLSNPSQNIQSDPMEKLQKRNMTLNKDFIQVK